jgi:membrane-bound lytic murein transglycosylase D
MTFTSTYSYCRRAVLLLLPLVAAIVIQSCGSAPKTTTENTKKDSTSTEVKNADPFSVLDDNGRVDSALVESRLEAARQEWLRALAAEGRKDKNEAIKRFESSIDILNRLIYFPGVSENKDFQELTRSVFEDYEKYVNKIDVLPPTSSIYAFRQKFNEEMSKMDIRNIPLPKPDELTHTQVPLVINPAVEQSIAYFMSGNGRAFMTKWLGRSGKFFPMMKKIFAEVGTPEELIYLSMIESGLNPTVTSRAQAVGLWQFIEGTGAMYGLKSNWWYDNKRDPVKETYAAARHLKDLYRAMGDWYLALCCYNCSMTRIRRCMNENQDSTFWGIRDCLPKETQNYVPLYIAATLIARDPAHYGFTDIQYDKAMVFDTVRVKEAVDLNALAIAAGTSGLELKDLNTELLQFSTPPPELTGPQGYVLRVPLGTAQNFYTKYAELTPEQKRPWMLHTVERGETLRSIARTYGLSTEQLASYNNMDAGERVKRGSRIRVPMTVMSPGAIASTDAGQTTITAPKEPPAPAPQPAASTTKKVIHRVRRGETLNSIASHYGIRVSDLRNWNNVGYHSHLKKGQSLAIYIERQPTITKETTQTAAQPAKAASKKHWVDYKVRSGDTMAKIADDFDVTLADIKKWNGKKVKHGVKSGQTIKLYSEQEYAATPETTVSDKPRVHTVRPGETMTSIASQYGTTVQKLSEWNDGKEASSLQAGEKLNVFAPNKTASKGDSDHSKPAKKVTYKVRRGDTLYSIAEKYGVDVSDLKSENNLRRNKIPAGKRLVIPGN